jgi:PKD repeat protein
VLGPHAVGWLDNGSAQIAFDGSDSWVPASTISAYAWSAPGSTAIDDDTSATPVITYDTAGTYRVSCTVTAANGETSTGYRRVFIYDADNPPVTEFQLRGNPRGDYESGGWTFGIEMYDRCALTDLVEGALVVLFALDWYGDDQVNIGPITGRENVITWGCIENETLIIDPEVGTAAFNVQGPSWWMQQCHLPAAHLGEAETTPVDWTEIESLTIDKWIWHLITWRSTAAMILDVIPSGDTRTAEMFDSESGSMWDKIREICKNRMATIIPACDHYGRLIVETDLQLLPVANRTTVPVVHALTDSDWREQIEIERRTIPTTSQVEVCGAASETVTSESQLWYSRALSKYEQGLGSIMVLDRVVATSQAEVNEICGLLYGNANNAFPLVVIKLAANHRMIDICPQQYLTLSISADQNPRGITWTAKPLVVRRITLAYDKENGVFLTDIEAEVETVPATAVPYYPPPEPINNELPEPDIDPDFSWTPPTLINPPQFIPPEIPPAASCLSSAPANGPYDTWMRGTLYDTDINSKFAVLRCRLRGTGADHPSLVQLNGRFYKRDSVNGVLTWSETTDVDFYTVYGIDAGGNRIASTVPEPVFPPYDIRYGTIAPAATTAISNVELAMNNSVGLIFDSYSPIEDIDRTTVISRSTFWNKTPNGCYIYQLWKLEGQAIPAGWYTEMTSLGLDIIYSNFAINSYVSVRRMINWGVSPLGHAQFWDIHNNNYIPSLYSNSFTPIPGGYMYFHDNTGFPQILTASPTRHLLVRDNFRVTTPTPGVAFQYYIKYEVWISRLATRRIDVDYLALWNVCPPED